MGNRQGASDNGTYVGGLLGKEADDPNFSEVFKSVIRSFCDGANVVAFRQWDGRGQPVASPIKEVWVHQNEECLGVLILDTLGEWLM